MHRIASFAGPAHRVASGGEDDTLRIWDADSGQLLPTLREGVGSTDPGRSGGVSCLGFDASGEYLGACFRDGSVRVWKAPGYAEGD